MYPNSLVDQLQEDYGVAILEGLTNQRLIRKGQKTRLFDETSTSAECFYPADNRGPCHIYNQQTGETWYPVKAYATAHKVDFTTALADLKHTYLIDTLRPLIRRPQSPQPSVPSTPIDYLPGDYYKQCQTKFERNGLYEYLRFTFGSIKADEVFTWYRLGTSKHWRYLGYYSTCLPQFDIAGNLRQIKILPFDAMNGRRVKKHQPAELWNPYTKQYKPTEDGADKTTFAGRMIAKQVGMTANNLKQCLFGEHLLSEYPERKVALVEGESTAIMCSIKWPEFLWLSTGGSTGAGWTKHETFSVLQDREVTLWPDTGKYKDWSQKADLLRPLVQSLYVSDYVDKKTPVGMGNVDLRDLLTRPRYFPHDGPIYGDVLS